MIEPSRQYKHSPINFEEKKYQIYINVISNYLLNTLDLISYDFFLLFLLLLLCFACFDFPLPFSFALLNVSWPNHVGFHSVVHMFCLVPVRENAVCTTALTSIAQTM